MVMFYVKDKMAGESQDGQDVAELLKEKIENEEGFFEFRMLKVEPYSKDTNQRTFVLHTIKRVVLETPCSVWYIWVYRPYS